jgi:hypothetical protein
MPDTLVKAVPQSDQEISMAITRTQRSPRIGSYLGHPVYQTIESQDAVYEFDRIAKNIDGEFPLDQLNRDELLVRPGLIYRPKP